MKENRAYFNKNRICKRIIRAFNESENECLTSQEVFSLLLDQTTKKGTKFTITYTKQNIAQTLNKYPFFEKSGVTKSKSMANNSMTVCCWRLSHMGRDS